VCGIRARRWCDLCERLRFRIIRCEQGDLLAVPDSTPHWFDMGPEPRFVVIRFFTQPEGWIGHFTGSDIAQKFPRYEAGAAG
jgi:1,2-dihydroxy-3-keto-5-methylthiopentene dioxygenase